METTDLARRRILVVEDEAMLALDIIDQVEQHNGVVIGPVASLQAGLRALDEHKPDACILNIRLGPDMVYALADRLLDAKIPFIFASGEQRADIPSRFIGVPLHGKPVDMVKAAVGLINHGDTRAGT